MKRKTSYLILFIFLISGITTLLIAGENPTRSAPLSDFCQLFEPGKILQDRNGDNVIDFVATQIVIPNHPNEAEIVAAANIAARFGFETTALDLPLLVKDNAVSEKRLSPNTIFIGSDHAMVKKFINQGILNLNTLAPGQGIIALVTDSLARWKSAIVVAGRDDSGLLAASHYLASRFPYLWELKGVTIADVTEKVYSYLKEQHVDRVWVVANSVTAERGRHGLVSASLTVHIFDKKDWEVTTKALETLSRNHAEAQSKLWREFPSLGQLVVEIRHNDLHRRFQLQAGPRAILPGQLIYESGIKPKKFSLSEFYTPKGFLGDSDKDFIPDRSDGILVLGSEAEATNLINLAARIGLESTGLRLPLVRLVAEVEPPTEWGTLLIVGKENPLIDRLIREKKYDILPLKSGQGVIQIIPKAFGEQTAMVIAGTDKNGLEAAISYLARHVPYLWDYGKGHVLLSAIEDEARRFFAARTPAGQAATALYRLRKMLSKLQGKALDSLSIRIYLEKAPEKLRHFVQKNILSQMDVPKISVKTAALEYDAAVPLIDENFQIPWEVDQFWEKFRNRVLSQVTPQSQVEVELRVSESPELRKDLEKSIRAVLRQHQVPEDHIRVSVLSAYKQGFSWINDQILPQLHGKDVGTITIGFATLEDDPAVRWQTIHSPIRWLQEIYPIDEVLARELNIPTSAIKFQKRPKGNPTYTIEVKDSKGRVIFSDQFNTKFIVRPFFDLFPEYESIRVTTGWVMAKVDKKVILDERIKTDPERFWDHYQSRTLPAIFEYVMNLYEGKPEARRAPYFGELLVELTMSEPDYRLGIDEECISSLEALHEDIYFETLAFFDLLGLRYAEKKLSAPGRIIPRILRARDGQAGSARITFRGKPAGNPRVVVQFWEHGASGQERRFDLEFVKVERPRIRGARVQAGRQGLSRLELEFKADTYRDRRDQLLRRARKEQVDQQIISAEQAASMIEILKKLHQAGLFTEEFSYPSLDELVFKIINEENKDSIKTVRLPISSKNYEFKDISQFAKSYQYRGERMVQWQTPIGPEECTELVARLNTFPEVTAYHAGRSYLGRDIWAMDVTLPHEAQFVSQAKLSTFKPVLFISGRQHANEVSSTSHILRLVELLVTDAGMKEYLKRVNLVIHPMANLDGAAIAYELQKITPYSMLHVGRLTALSIDIDEQMWDSDPLCPESRVRRELWQRWLPDIYVNPHGYPSHEWVQLFAGYTAWVRNRRPTARDWWAPRAWFIPRFNYIQDEKYPKHKEVAMKLRDYVVDEVMNDAEIRALNERMYARYFKYGRWDPESYKEDFHKGLLVYTALKGSKLDPKSRSFMMRHPNVTVFDAICEAPDETARGPWLELVCKAGLKYDLAHLKFLYNAEYKIKRQYKQLANSVWLAVKRKRPVMPPKKEISPDVGETK